MTTPTAKQPADPLALLRTRGYLALLVLAAILGVPIAAVAYGFLKLVDVIQKAVFTQLPSGLGFDGEPLWWPLLPLALAGVLVALTIRYLPGKGGHSPADGFKPRGAITPEQIPGVFLAALATLSLGAVLGPEAPLIALGGGLAVLALHFSKRDMPAQTLAVIGSAGSFAAIIGTAIQRLALAVRPHVERRLVLLTPMAGLAVAGLAIAYAAATGKDSSEVLFSGQSALPTFVDQAASYSVGALLLLIACKGLAYSVSLSSFRGGPVFPAMFLGAAGGVAMSHLPGLPLVPAVAMGIGAMSVTMLRLPLTSVLLATLLLASDGLAVTPLVIVAVVVAYVVAARIAPPTDKTPAAESEPAPAAREPAPAPGAAPATGTVR
jgi:H+/Cl- antiporter ClcA